jgi:tRNA (guanine-N7-)-methyltransferase
MSRKLKYDIPGTDWRVRPEALEELGSARLFGRAPDAPLELVVDLGFGRGEFLMELAEKDPASAFLGVEISHKRVLKMARRLARSALANVRILEAGAEAVVGCLAEVSVACFWINFPDPWPKKRHQRRRLIQPPLVAALARRLRPGGVVHVATDHMGYGEQIDEVLRAEPLLENLYAPESFRRMVVGRPPTAYELEWRAEGRSFHFFSYRRVEAR